MSLIQILCDLQAVDQEWDEKARVYQEARRRLSDRSELEGERKAQEHRAGEMSLKRAKLHDEELELASLQEKFRAVETALYGGEIASPRELDNLRKDGEYLRRRMSVLEDDVLLAMTELDELETEVASGQESLQSLEQRWAAEHDQLAGQYRDLHGRLQELKAAREQLRGTIARGDLALYDELRRTKGGRALSPVQGGLCLTCRVTVPAYKIHVIEEEETAVATCEGCGRILFRS